MSSRDRALAIIELLAHHPRGLPLSEIGDRLAVPRSATHRLLAELRENGYVRQDFEGGVYRLTMKLPALGLAFLGASGISDLVQPILDQFAEATGELVLLCVLEGERLMRVAKAQGARHGIQYSPSEGSEVYLAATANGFALLSCLDDDAAIELVARQGFRREGFGPNQPQTLREMLAFVQDARERGFSLIEEVFELGTSAVAAPIRHITRGDVIGTVSVAGPSLRMKRPQLEAMVPPLLQAATDLAAAASRSPIFAAN